MSKPSDMSVAELIANQQKEIKDLKEEREYLRAENKIVKAALLECAEECSRAKSQMAYQKMLAELRLLSLQEYRRKGVSVTLEVRA